MSKSNQTESVIAAKRFIRGYDSLAAKNRHTPARMPIDHLNKPVKTHECAQYTRRAHVVTNDRDEHGERVIDVREYCVKCYLNELQRQSVEVYKKHSRQIRLHDDIANDPIMRILKMAQKLNMSLQEYRDFLNARMRGDMSD